MLNVSRISAFEFAGPCGTHLASLREGSRHLPSYYLPHLLSDFMIISLDVYVYMYYNTPCSVGAACRRTKVSLTLPCRWRVRFSVWCAWPFFDIWILSRRPFCNLCNRCRDEPVARPQRGQPVNSGHRPDAASRGARHLQRFRSGLPGWSLSPSPGNLENFKI